ncbi:Protein of unknown function [Gryllus bimaculatus]|nr:Protein of unknown function [Gryllus bimaculatus]
MVRWRGGGGGFQAATRVLEVVGEEREVGLGHLHGGGGPVGAATPGVSQPPLGALPLATRAGRSLRGAWRRRATPLTHRRPVTSRHPRAADVAPAAAAAAIMAVAAAVARSVAVPGSVGRWRARAKQPLGAGTRRAPPAGGDIVV